MARGANPDLKSAAGDGHRHSPADQTAGSPLQLPPDKGRHEVSHATGSLSGRVKMVRVRTVHSHPHPKPNPFRVQAPCPTPIAKALW